MSRVRLALVVAPWAVALACAGDIGRSEPGGDGAFVAQSGSAAPSLAGSGPGTGAGGAGAAAASGGAGDRAVADGCAVPDTGASVLRRLSREEYRRTLQDLFQLDAPPAVDQVPEDAQQGGFRTTAAIQSVSDQHLLAYLETAERLSAELMADAARRARVIGCDVAAADCLRGFVERFGRLSFRRPLDAQEVSSLTSAAQAGASDTSDAYRFAIEALLTAPSFLFRVEVGDGEPLAELSGSELASRLSFMLQGRGPGAELLDRADAGELATAEDMLAVARELLAAPDARSSFGSFFKQWLGFEQLRVPNTPPPGFSEALLPEMISETERFLDDFAWQPGARFTDSLFANFTYLTPALGAFYDVSVPAGSGFARVEFPAGHPRAGTGLLTHASVLSSKTDADLISHRGAFLRDAFLCHKLAIPSELQQEIQDSVAGLSYIEVIALRNRQQPCAGCHAQIDPIGVAFAQYDAIGHHDASIGTDEFGITPSFAGLAEPDFATLAELANKLAAEPAVLACIAEKLFVYTEGREPGPADACTLALARERFAQSGGQFPELLAAFVQAPAFRLRRVR